MEDKIRIGLIYGSVREGRFCDKVAAWAAAEIEKRSEFSLDSIDPASLDLPFRHKGENSAGLVELHRRAGDADAFVVVTPEYNHSYPAVLKLLIDSVNQQWRAKPVAFVSYGGVSGGLRAVEHLRHVFAELHAVTIRDGVSFANAWRQFGSDGILLDPATPRKSMSVLLDRLNWWAIALRNARKATPYDLEAA